MSTASLNAMMPIHLASAYRPIHTASATMTATAATKISFSVLDITHIAHPHIGTLTVQFRAECKMRNIFTRRRPAVPH